MRAGNWIREYRGIYRLADFPTGDRPDLMLWYLWSQNRKEVPEGTYSHETALSLHELSDIMPSKLDMIVPNSSLAKRGKNWTVLRKAAAVTPSKRAWMGGNSRAFT